MWLNKSFLENYNLMNSELLPKIIHIAHYSFLLSNCYIELSVVWIGNTSIILYPFFSQSYYAIQSTLKNTTECCARVP